MDGTRLVRIAYAQGRDAHRRERAAFEAAQRELCGGVYSGDEGSSFRGRIGMELFRRSVRGCASPADYAPPATGPEVTTALTWEWTDERGLVSSVIVHAVATGCHLCIPGVRGVQTGTRPFI